MLVQRCFMTIACYQYMTRAGGMYYCNSVTFGQIQNSAKLSKTGQNWAKLGKTGQNWAKLSKTGQNCAKLGKTGQNWAKLGETR